MVLIGAILTSRMNGSGGCDFNIQRWNRGKEGAKARLCCQKCARQWKKKLEVHDIPREQQGVPQILPQSGSSDERPARSV